MTSTRDLEALELQLAKFALLSLAFTTKEVIASDRLARDFFEKLRLSVRPDLLPEPYAIDKLIQLARTGEAELEALVAAHPMTHYST